MARFPVVSGYTLELGAVCVELLRLGILALLTQDVFIVCGVAAGTRRAGESKLKDPDAPSKGLLCILPRAFDILNTPLLKFYPF